MSGFDTASKAILWFLSSFVVKKGYFWPNSTQKPATPPWGSVGNGDLWRSLLQFAPLFNRSII
tara:strand:+ start:278 stop:466 length:189 start_codon:yes stop_codon:yes gene_type:complete